MMKNPFTLSEAYAMWDDRDTLSIMAFIAIVISPILVFISLFLKHVESEYYSPYGWGIPTLIFLVFGAFIYIYRPWFLSNMDNKINKCFNEILQEYHDTQKSIVDIANKHLSNPKLNKKFVNRVADKVTAFKKEEDDRLNSFNQSPY
jgi:hypothetical protein